MSWLYQPILQGAEQLITDIHPELLEGEGELFAPLVFISEHYDAATFEGEGAFYAPKVWASRGLLQGEGDLLGTVVEAHEVLAASQDNPLEAEGELFAPTVTGGRLMGFLQGEGDLLSISIKIQVPPLTVLMNDYLEGEGDLWGQLVEGHRVLAASQDEPLEGEGEILAPYVEGRSFDIDVLEGEGDLFGEVTGVEMALHPDELEGEGELLTITVVAQVGDSCTVRLSVLEGEGDLAASDIEGEENVIRRPELLEGEGEILEITIKTSVVRILGLLQGEGQWLRVPLQAPWAEGRRGAEEFAVVMSD
ncbi:MAG: hypothetical protein MUF84_11635 [Anaerolineae bacterium]|jgi:hypothetical protein|nr:hypothetical protein [Anaerolineae bacterium]